MENKEFNFKKELQKIYEEELSGKITNAGRVYRKLLLRDKEFIRLLKEEIKQHLDFSDVDGRRIVYHMTDKDYDEFFDIIDKLAGSKLTE